MAGLLWAETQLLRLEGSPKWLTGQGKETIPLTTSRDSWGRLRAAHARKAGKKTRHQSYQQAGQLRGPEGWVHLQRAPLAKESLVKGHSCRKGPSLKASCPPTLLIHRSPQVPHGPNACPPWE